MPLILALVALARVMTRVAFTTLSHAAPGISGAASCRLKVGIHIAVKMFRLIV